MTSDETTGGAGGEIPLPGGGVLREAPKDDDAPVLPGGFEALVQPFVLLALTGLGVLPHPETGRPQKNLAAAKVAIDTLDLLRDRTRGNLAPDEQRLLEQALLSLRMQFVEAKERG